jgi:CheY-like chemotaxis protein
MGGTLSVTSQLGSGSCFRFQIQAERAEADIIPLSTHDQKVTGIEAGQPSYRILIVEDKPSNRQLMVELLQSVGFEVREASNGQVAIPPCQEWSPHLIWMDLRMPVMDGYEATRRIKAFDPAPIVIALTGSALEEERAIAQELGISVSGMKSRVQRGRQKLRDLLQTCCELELDAMGNVIHYEMKDISLCRSCGLAD